MPYVFVNNFSCALGSALANARTPGTSGTLTLQPGFGAQLPAIAAPFTLRLTITEGTNVEVVEVTAHTASADTCTVTWALENIGTVAPTCFNFTTAALVEARLTAGSLPNEGIATIDFGPTPADFTSLVVSGQAGISANVRLEADFMREATIDNTADDHEQAASLIALVLGDIIASTSFTITATSMGPQVTGTFKVRWAWN